MQGRVLPFLARAAALALAFLVSAAVVTPAIAAERDPTDFEQYMLELINRARSDPPAEVERTDGSSEWEGTPDLNEGLPPGTISTNPKQPLAFNGMLTQAASDYSDLLIAEDAFTHTFGETDPMSRMEDEGYSFPMEGSWTWGENLAISGSTGPFPTTLERVDDQHVGLFADEDSPTRGHRITLMNPAFREVGIGVREGSDYMTQGTTFNVILTTQDFAVSSGSNGGDPFLTGVAMIDDIFEDDFYTPAEGLSVAVNAYEPGTTNLVLSTQTFGSGGYTLAGLVSGFYDIEFFGPGVNHTVENVDFTGSSNVKVDLIIDAILGDATGDRLVGPEDFTIWANDFGMSGPDLPADYNLDGEVGPQDYTLWANHFGATQSPANPQQASALAAEYGIWANNFGLGNSAAVQAIPEPSTAVLAILGAALVFIPSARRGRRNS